MVCVLFEIPYWNGKLLNTTLHYCLVKHEQTHELDSCTQHTSFN